MTKAGISSFGITRRQTLTSAAVVGVGVPLLAACGSDGSDGSTSTPSTGPTSGSASASPTPTPTESASKEAETPAEPPTDSLAETTGVPQGGGTIFADEKVVVTQPAAGEFKCFTAVCTHAACVVSSVEGGTINCACHGSRFSILDGSVQRGPASSPLSEVPISVQGGAISLS